MWKLLQRRRMKNCRMDSQIKIKRETTNKVVVKKLPSLKKSQRRTPRTGSGKKFKRKKLEKVLRSRSTLSRLRVSRSKSRVR